ncbi:hypothetical protein AVEN_72815-1 [Araneus ventricosus]|uniref:Uncharacterized protein n=1 Tax=Araneus ventricosus TaxID=182803 RepID=A0A4Y2PEW5_ARAVE|nr:hypothetical protein AVEN_72815-1 [Araneus ventricosus]
MREFKVSQTPTVHPASSSVPRLTILFLWRWKISFPPFNIKHHLLFSPSSPNEFSASFSLSFRTFFQIYRVSPSSNRVPSTNSSSNRVPSTNCSSNRVPSTNSSSNRVPSTNSSSNRVPATNSSSKSNFLKLCAAHFSVSVFI